MFRFLPNIFIDYSSFWLGALLAIVLLFLIFKFRTRVISFLRQIGSSILGFRDQLSVTSDKDYVNVLNKYVQGSHIQADLFPLDAILIKPLCIAPPIALRPGEENLDPSLILQTLGYDPYLPDLAVEYFSPTISLYDALAKNANICLVGFPGCGKTTAIADCISKMLKVSAQEADNRNRIPFYTKAHHLLAQFPDSDLLEVILSALQCNQLFRTIPDFPLYLTTTINSGEAVLFIDDLDLLTYKDINRIANFLSAVINTIPSLQLIVTASPSCLGYLSKAPLEHVSIAPWNEKTKYSYLQKWRGQLHQPNKSVSGITTDSSDIQNSMLVVSDRFSTPLEFTLKAWAADAGDIRGPSSPHAIEAFLKRCFPINTPNSLAVLEAIALYSLDQEISSFNRKDFRSWFSKNKASGDTEALNDNLGQLTPVLQDARNFGILNKDGSDGSYFASATVGGYLAAKGLRRLRPERISKILDQPGWSLKYETMRFISVFNDIGPFLHKLQSDQSIMKDNLVQAGNWLAYTEHNSPNEIDLLKAITREILTNQAYLVKLRLVTILAKSGNPSTKSIFHHLLKSNDLETRRAAALGTGLIQDISAVSQLISMLDDTYPTSTASCYALGKIGSPKSLDRIAYTLLHGNELLRRSSAECLAQNRSEGHPALREGSSMKDLLVRHAVVHGLSLIEEDWVLDILDKMRIEEAEWVVRELAKQVYEIHKTGSPYIPVTRPSPSSATWLHKFASKQDLPNPTPETALEVLLLALEMGSSEQKQASLEYLSSLGGVEIIPELTKFFRHPNPDVRQQAMITAWNCSPPEYKLTI